MFSFLAAALAFVATATANPAVSPQYGVVGQQISRTAICNSTQEATCMEFINNTHQAVAFGFTWTGGGVQNALVTESGTTQCVFTQGPTGTRCVSVLGPGERGWVAMPVQGVIGVQVTRWSMPGLEKESPSAMPQNPALPVTVLGDPYLIMQGTLATQSGRGSCEVDLNVRGANTLYVGMCR